MLSSSLLMYSRCKLYILSSLSHILISKDSRHSLKAGLLLLLFRNTILTHPPVHLTPDTGGMDWVTRLLLAVVSRDFFLNGNKDENALEKPEHIHVACTEPTIALSPF